MKNILVVAPHADDETLGCGGTLLKLGAEKNHISWLLMTEMTPGSGYLPVQIRRREREIQRVSGCYRFRKTYRLGFPAAKLEMISLTEIVRAMGAVIRDAEPEIVFVPFGGDVHTDHLMTCKAMASCSKWFRYPSIKKILAYETLSETDIAPPKKNVSFNPQVFSDISRYLNKKIRILYTYKSELGKFPFPRSSKAIRALAAVRGVACGYRAAEAFMLIKEIC